ncbi:hypothetical protein ACLXAU_25560, partial [Escherichia coli]
VGDFIYTRAFQMMNQASVRSKVLEVIVRSRINFGNAASVLVGDFIYTRAFQMMNQASVRSKVLEVIVRSRIN